MSAGTTADFGGEVWNMAVLFWYPIESRESNDESKSGGEEVILVYTGSEESGEQVVPYYIGSEESGEYR